MIRTKNAVLDCLLLGLACYNIGSRESCDIGPIVGVGQLARSRRLPLVACMGSSLHHWSPACQRSEGVLGRTREGWLWDDNRWRLQRAEGGRTTSYPGTSLPIIFSFVHFVVSRSTRHSLEASIIKWASAGFIVNADEFFSGNWPFDQSHVYVGHTSNPSFVGPEPLPKLAAHINQSVGPSGPNKVRLDFGELIGRTPICRC